MSNKQIEAMRKVGMDGTEIADILEADKRIDRGEKLFELPDELKVGAKKARQADRKQTAPTKREHKPDADKLAIMDCIKDNLFCLIDKIEVVNPEREILFTYNEKKYKIVLSCPRP